MILGYFILTLCSVKAEPSARLHCTPPIAGSRSSLGFGGYCFLFGGEASAGLDFSAVCMVYRLAERFTLEAAVRNVLTSFVSLL